MRLAAVTSNVIFFVVVFSLAWAVLFVVRS